MMRLCARTLGPLALVVLAAYAVPSLAADAVTIAYQTGVDPSKVVQAEGRFEKETATPISWRKFESGAAVIAAIAAGDVAIGNIGSSPLAAAACRGLAIGVFFVASQLGDSEALVVRNGSGIAKPQDLIGRRVAVPYVSTTHYSLLAALRRWGIAPTRLAVVNLRPSEIVAAWQRGDIDATYVWEPALGRLKENGSVLITSSQVAAWGSPTYDTWIVRSDFAQTHTQFLTRFVRVASAAFADFNRDPKGFAAAADNIDKIVRVTGSTPQSAQLMLLGNRYPSLTEQVDLLQAPFSRVIQDTAEFLRSQGKVDAVPLDFSPYVSNRFVKAVRAEGNQ